MKIYELTRDLLSEKNQGRLSRLVLQCGLKPRVNRGARSTLKRGAVLFTADFEMAWAFRFSRTCRPRAVEMGMLERRNVPILLDLFARHSLPATWATIGHLFLGRCSRDASGRAHPEMPRPGYFSNRNWRFTAGDWYDDDPCTSLADDPAWYAPDLVERILSAGPGHEIACHSFSHVDFSDGNCPKGLANAELDACQSLAAEVGVRLKSMVFPGGTLGNFASLKERGFLCYRRPSKYHLDLPTSGSGGLIAVPSSLGLERDPYGWSKDFHLGMIRKFLDRAARSRLACHFWFHPSMDIWYLENVMPGIIEMVAAYRDAGMLRPMTMAGVSEAVLPRGPVGPETRETGSGAAT